MTRRVLRRTWTAHLWSWLELEEETVSRYSRCRTPICAYGGVKFDVEQRANAFHFTTDANSVTYGLTMYALTVRLGGKVSGCFDAQ